MPTLADLSLLEAVARHRSFRAAADELGLTRSAVSHAIRGLETELAVRLFHRTTRSVAPTEAGMRLLTRLRPTLNDLKDMLAQAGAKEGAPAGTLRINAIQAAAVWLMRHVVPSFLDRCPHVMLELTSENRFIDIVAHNFDAGVRLAEAVPQDMIAVRFGGPVRFATVASPAYLARHGAPAAPEDLLRHGCIRQRLASGKLYRWEYASNADECTIDVPGTLTLDDNEVMVEAAIAGLGIAYVPEQSAASAIAAGRLETVLEAWSPPIGGFCLYFPGHRHIPPPLRAFVDMLRSH